jgi:hypothetical protein
MRSRLRELLLRRLDDAADEPGSLTLDDVALLSRGGGAVIDIPWMFGGGYPVARVRRRSPVQAYGYPAVVEEFEAVLDDAFGGEPATTVRWTTLAVSLPNSVATLVVDHRSAVDRTYIERAPFTRDTGDIEFDLDYVASAESLEALHDLLTVDVRTALIQRPVQRTVFSGSRLMIRTFDDVEATREVIHLLRGLAAEILVGTPAFLSILDPGRLAPFPRGLHGHD